MPIKPSDYGWLVLRERVEEASGIQLKLEERRSTGGGCINDTFWVPGQRNQVESPVFVKRNLARKAAMFEAESEGLNAIAATGTIRVPRPICLVISGEEAFLVLEGIEMTSNAGTESQARMGKHLAALHRVTSPAGQFGWHRDNTIGELPQRNAWTATWTEFFREHRLKPQFEIARSKGRPFQQDKELLKRLPELVRGHEPAPSLLHGDLWGGNAGFDTQGEPVIYDPATYYGDRETDLAFTEMFGGFGSEFYAAYNAAWPLDAGYDSRRPLYNLYHVLNHYNHFGGGYAAQADSIIEQLISRSTSLDQIA